MNCIQFPRVFFLAVIFNTVITGFGIQPIGASDQGIYDLVYLVKKIENRDLERAEIRESLQKDPFQEDQWAGLYGVERWRLVDVEKIALEWTRVEWEDRSLTGSTERPNEVLRRWKNTFPESGRPYCEQASTASDTRWASDLLKSRLKETPSDIDLQRCFLEHSIKNGTEREAREFFKALRLIQPEVTADPENQNRSEDRIPDVVSSFEELIELEKTQPSIEQIYLEYSAQAESLEDRFELCAVLLESQNDDFGCVSDLLGSMKDSLPLSWDEKRGLQKLQDAGIHHGDVETLEELFREAPSLYQKLRMLNESLHFNISGLCAFAPELWAGGAFEAGLSGGSCRASELDALVRCGLTTEADLFAQSIVDHRIEDHLRDCKFSSKALPFIRRELNARLESEKLRPELMAALWTFRTGQPKESCSLLKQWSQLSPKVEPARELAKCMSDWESRREAYLEAAHRGDGDSLLHVAQTAIGRKEFEWADSTLTKYLAQGQPTHRQAMEASWLRGQALRGLGRLQLAYDAFEKYYLARLRWTGRFDSLWVDQPYILELAQSDSPHRLVRYLKLRKATLLETSENLPAAWTVTSLDPLTEALVRRLQNGAVYQEALEEELALGEGLMKARRADWLGGEPEYRRDYAMSRSFLPQKLEEVRNILRPSPILPGSSQDRWLRTNLGF